MFTHSADLYDIIYGFKDYAKEAADITQIIRARRPECRTILDAGCGTSEHHKYLKKYFSVDGIDLEPKFAEISKRKNPEGSYFAADMRDFELAKKYDAVICLFSSIGYLKNMEEIISALRCFHAHLKSGGLLILEPWFSKENILPGKVHTITAEKDGLSVCRMNKSFIEGDFSVIPFHYLVGSINEGVHHFTEEHRLRLTSKNEMASAFKTASFDVQYDETGLMGRGMYFGMKK